MSEPQSQSQSESQTQTQSQTQINVRVFYLIHPDDFSSTHLQPLIILYNGKVYNAFVKNRIGRPDMYYVVSDKAYVKLWNDTKGNVLVYISSAYVNNMFFTQDVDIIRVEENIIYEYDTRKLLCGDKTVTLSGFDIIKAIDELQPELLPPMFAIICYRLL